MEESKAVIRKYEAGDEVKILRLFNEVFGLDRTIDHWNWRFRDHCQGPGWITLAEDEIGVVGQDFLMRNHLNYKGREIIAAQSCDIMVRPDQRGKRWRTRLSTRNYQCASRMGANAVFGFPNRNSYPAAMRSLHWDRIASLKHYSVRIGLAKIWGQRSDRIFKYLYKSFAKFKCSFTALRQKQDLIISVSSHLSDDIEDMLREIRDYEVLSIWKDRKYMKWRYEDHPDHKYLFHMISLKGDPHGLIVTRDCGNTIVICEVLHKTKDVIQTVLLLYDVLNRYVLSKAQKVEFYGFDAGFFDAVFAACGFKIQPYSNFIFGGKVFNDSLPGEVFRLPHNWTIVSGDIDVM